MKKFIILFTLFVTMAHANEKGNGGDPCERKINEIRSKLLTWIKNGASKELDFSKRPDISSREYELRMKNILASRIEEGEHGAIETSRVNVSCTTNEERVTVAGIKKTCVNEVGGEILCNFKRFLATSESEQYRLIHHEYAGVAGIEVNYGLESDFSLSNQIEAESVKNLATNLIGKVKRKFSRAKKIKGSDISGNYWAGTCFNQFSPNMPEHRACYIFTEEIGSFGKREKIVCKTLFYNPSRDQVLRSLDKYILHQEMRSSTFSNTLINSNTDLFFKKERWITRMRLSKEYLYLQENLARGNYTASACELKKKQ